MKNNLNRRFEIFKDALPSIGSTAYKKTIAQIEKNSARNPEVEKFTKRNWEIATKSLEVQMLSECGLITESALRHYLYEFNSRAWKHGLRSMPLMFNIMESYFNYRKPEGYFELLEEENYLISFFDFLEDFSSLNLKENQALISQNIESELIYNFNATKDLEKIKFKTVNGEEFIIAGISLLRRDNELTVLLITGKKQTDFSKIQPVNLKYDLKNPNKTALIKEMQENLKNNSLEYEYIDDDKKYIKTLVTSRIDLDTMTIDARYVAEEMNLTFNVITDEIDGFLDDKGEFSTNELKDVYLNCKNNIEKYKPIFDVSIQALYLPYYLALNEEIIKEETLDTKLKTKFNNPLTRRRYKDTIGFKSYIKSIYSLDKLNIFTPDSIKLRDDLFNVQSSGYWKNISSNDIGMDKKGSPIHGKTWVNQSLSWFEATEGDLIIEKETESYNEPNSGYIYILRNPTMEKNLFKIGLTRNDVNERASQLSKTSVPDKFYKSQEWNVRDCIKAEKEIHQLLSSFRVDPRREFFKIDYDKAISVIKGVVEIINNN